MLKYWCNSRDVLSKSLFEMIDVVVAGEESPEGAALPTANWGVEISTIEAGDV